MKIIHPTLINFSAFSCLNLYSGEAIISKSGIIHTKRTECDICCAPCYYNGSSNKGRHALSRSNNSFFRKGQQYCPICERTIQVENSWIDEITESINQFLSSQIISLSEYLSEEEIVTHLNSTMGIKISKSKVHEVINTSNKEFENINFDYEVTDGFYGYDEQFIKIDGKRAYRIVFYDLTSNKIIYEKIHYKFSKKILIEILEEVFPDTKPKGFVVDMRVEYPNAFKSVFGKKIRIQFCVFHLNKLIVKEYGDSLKIGKNIKWTLTDKYNLYSLLNIFYDRSFELKILKNMMKHLENFKMKITEEKVQFYADKYKITLKTYENKRSEVIKIIEKKLLKSFRTILHDKRLLRRRKKVTLKVRTKDSANKIFEDIKQKKQYFPEKIQKRIERIEKNFEFFTASDGEVLTNNRLEGFFGATLKKFRKKSRKSLISFSALLKRKRAKEEGKDFYRKFTICDLAKIFTASAIFQN